MREELPGKWCLWARRFCRKGLAQVKKDLGGAAQCPSAIKSVHLIR